MECVLNLISSFDYFHNICDTAAGEYLAGELLFIMGFGAR